MCVQILTASPLFVFYGLFPLKSLESSHMAHHQDQLEANFAADIQDAVSMNVAHCSHCVLLK